GQAAASILSLLLGGVLVIVMIGIALIGIGRFGLVLVPIVIQRPEQCIVITRGIDRLIGLGEWRWVAVIGIRIGILDRVAAQGMLVAGEVLSQVIFGRIIFGRIIL